MFRFQEGGILGHVVDRQQDLGVELVAGNQVGYVGLVVPLTSVVPALRVEGPQLPRQDRRVLLPATLGPYKGLLLLS